MTTHAMKLAVLLFAASLLVYGCGDSGPTLYPVEGTVSYQGRPLPMGTVMFVPSEGPPSKPAAIGPDGRYRLEAVAGRHRVQVVATPERTGGRPDPNSESGMDYTGVPEPKSLIPAKYTRFHTSGIEVTVEAVETNTIPIELK